MIPTSSILTYTAHNNSEVNSLEGSLAALGNNPFDRFDSLPFSFSPELQEKWKNRIEQALLNAIKKSDNKKLLLDAITQLDQRGYDLNSPIHDPLNSGYTLFCIACQAGYSEMVELLLKNPRIDPNRTINTGATPFFVACQNGRYDVIELLLKDPRVALNQPNNGEATPFYIACQNGHSNVIELLLKDPRIDPNQPTNGGATPFLVACHNGHSKVIKLLLKDPRIDPNQPTNDGVTPFIIACHIGRYEVIKLLLKDPRIDPNQPTNDGATPFFIACQNGHSDVIELLLKYPRIDPNQPMNGGATPFYIACQIGHIRIIELLLEADRVDANKAAHTNGDTLLNRHTPFSIVCKKKNIEGVKLLIKNPRLNLNAPINQQQFAKVVESKEMELVELFLAIASRNQELRKWIQAEFRNNRDTWINNECLNKEFPELLKSDASEEDFREKGTYLHTKHFGTFESAAIYAAFVLLSDGFFRMKSEEEMVNATQEEMSLWKNWKRLSKIAVTLPMELQMIVALRALGSRKVVILSRDSEKAFRYLFKHCRS